MKWNEMKIIDKEKETYLLNRRVFKKASYAFAYAFVFVNLLLTSELIRIWFFENLH